MIKEECRKQKLELGDMDTTVEDLVEWKIYQLHKAAKRKHVKSSRLIGKGSYSESVNGGMVTCLETHREA